MNFIKYRRSDLYDKVVDEYEIFEYGYDFMVFLAVMGYRENNVKRENYEGNDADETQGQIGVENFFNNGSYRTIAACLTFQDTGDPEKLNRQNAEEEQIETLTQYAAGGLEIAEKEFGQIAGDPTDAIVNYIKRQQEPDTYQGTLGEIVEEFNEGVLDE
jgi:dnd system-associated protein 4